MIQEEELIRIIANYIELQGQQGGSSVKTWEWALRCGGSFSLTPPGGRDSSVM